MTPEKRLAAFLKLHEATTVIDREGEKTALALLALRRKKINRAVDSCGTRLEAPSK